MDPRAREAGFLNPVNCAVQLGLTHFSQKESSVACIKAGGMHQTHGLQYDSQA